MPASIVYCHCAYAKVITPEVKREVLARLLESGVPFDAVPDLCQLSAAKDPWLKQLVERPGVRICACYPRAVKSLLAFAEVQPAADAEFLNMRAQSAPTIVDRLLTTTEETQP